MDARSAMMIESATCVDEFMQGLDFKLMDRKDALYNRWLTAGMPSAS